jgi:hypothetical protein
MIANPFWSRLREGVLPGLVDAAPDLVAPISTSAYSARQVT